MSENATAILLGVLGSSAFCELVRYYIGRKTSKNEITKRLDKLEKDGVRLQLMVLMSDFPEKKDEIMEVAKHYFYDLKGNWYMTSIYNEWLKKEKIEQPSWLK